MAEKKRIVQCVPNFSEGRDLDKIEKIVDAFRGKEGLKLLDYQKDRDHNRLVISVVGEPEPLKAGVIEAVGTAIDLIDMKIHKGEHPRMGAVDVVPFIPVKNITMAEAVEISKEVAAEIAEKLRLPVFLYEESATSPNRKDLAVIRKGEFEGMQEKLKAPEWRPDFGPARAHPTAGVMAIGARMPLVAFNVNLNSADINIANEIAKKVRYSSGGLRYCKAIGVALKQRGVVQVSMNMTDFTKTALYRAFELVRTESRQYGVNVMGSEIVGLVPMAALIDTASFYLGLENFSIDQVLESHLME